MPRVTITVPIFGGVQYLAACLDSLLNQSVEDVEVIVVPVLGDTPVLDALAELDDPRIRIVASDYACITHQMNLGWLASRSPWHMWFGADDVLIPAALADLLDIAESHAAGLVYPDFWITDSVLRNRRRYSAADHSPDRLRQTCYVCDQALVSRAAAEPHMPLKLQSGRRRVWNLWLALAADQNVRFAHAAVPAWLYRQHVSNEHYRLTQQHHTWTCIGPAPDWPDLPPQAADTSSAITVYSRQPELLLGRLAEFAFRRIICEWTDAGAIDRLAQMFPARVRHVTQDKALAYRLQVLGLRASVLSQHEIAALITEERYDT